MDYAVGKLLRLYLSGFWCGYVESPSGNVRIVYKNAILPDGRFANANKLDRRFPRRIIVGEDIAYILEVTSDNRLRAKAWRPIKW